MLVMYVLATLWHPYLPYGTVCGESSCASVRETAGCCLAVRRGEYINKKCTCPSVMVSRKINELALSCDVGAATTTATSLSGSGPSKRPSQWTLISHISLLFICRQDIFYSIYSNVKERLCNWFTVFLEKSQLYCRVIATFLRSIIPAFYHVPGGRCSF